MKPILFLAADYANLTSEGKLNVMGIFNVINADKFPARHASMYIIAKLMAELGEESQTRDVTIFLHSPDGHELLKAGGTLQIPKRVKGQKPEISLIINLQNVIFPEPGPYQFNLMVDKDHKDEFMIHVEQTETNKTVP